MDLSIPELTTIINGIAEIKTKINVIENKVQQEWFNDKQCWELKGGMALNTYRNNRKYQCKGGIPDAYVGGRKVWSKESVMEWLAITDDKLEDYHQKYKTGVEICKNQKN